MTRTPLWYWATAGAGLIWNAYGTWQFGLSLTATTQSLVASGLTPEQAQVMTTYPAWMTLAFALGVLGGLVGSVLLLLRHRTALERLRFQEVLDQLPSHWSAARLAHAAPALSPLPPSR